MPVLCRDWVRDEPGGRMSCEIPRWFYIEIVARLGEPTEFPPPRIGPKLEGAIEGGTGRVVGVDP